MNFIFKVYIKGLLTDIYDIRKRTIKIGRHIDNDIIIKGESISRFHAEIIIGSDNNLEIREKSVNGTFVNGNKVNEQHALKESDQIIIGPYKIVPEGKDTSVESINPSEEHSETVKVDIGDDKLKNYLSKKDRKSTRLNSSHTVISYAVFCLKNNTVP